MIIPDVNVLVFAHRRDSPDHEQYKAWLSGLVAGDDELGLANPVLIGFVRIVTNQRIFRDPTPIASALHFVSALRRGTRARPLPASDPVWRAFGALTGADRRVRGNLVPDAWIAAHALAHGGRVATNDHGFARFDGLSWFDPAR